MSNFFYLFLTPESGSKPPKMRVKSGPMLLLSDFYLEPFPLILEGQKRPVCGDPAILLGCSVCKGLSNSYSDFCLQSITLLHFSVNNRVCQ